MQLPQGVVGHMGKGSAAEGAFASTLFQMQHASFQDSGKENMGLSKPLANIPLYTINV